MNSPLRLAVLPDFAEERWPSMDLCAEMLLGELGREADVAATDCRPRYRTILGRLPLLGRSRLIRNVERLRNRRSTYPRHLRAVRDRFDFFHVCDHSYAHLVNSLPAGRTGVYCHDLDAFRCVLDPTAEPRPRWFRKMAADILRGLQSAAVVFCPSHAVRDQILAHRLIDPDRVIVAHNGVADEFHAAGATPPDGPATNGPYVLNVGSCIPRKRVGLLLEIFAAVKRQLPNVRLEQVGGEWTADHLATIDRLGIGPSVRQRRGLMRAELAACYRDAALVLQPSAAEGFGLPLVEALACGAPVLATDLPVFREVGGPAASFVLDGEADRWAERAVAALRDPAALPARATRLEWAANFSWRRQARTIVDAYRNLAAGRAPAAGT